MDIKKAKGNTEGFCRRMQYSALTINLPGRELFAVPWLPSNRTGWFEFSTLDG